MGYYVSTTHVDLFIPATKIPAAFEALRALNAPENDHLKRGGSWTGGKKTAVWYSWMSTDWHLTCKSVKDIFEELGFEDCEEDGLGFRLGSYNQKSGQEEIFLNAVAPFALPGKIEWTGEDGDRWANLFELGKMTTAARSSLLWDEETGEYSKPPLSMH